jgi:hypothetical protein
MIAGMLNPVLDRTRPGIRFEAGPPPISEAMPRMDVAAFIGFAERGPLHWPVAIEDMAQFEKVFGVTPKLGWTEHGERIFGHLAESVSAFFTQGGRRCWVVRVAGTSASSKKFFIPNLFKVTPSSGGFRVLPALVQARSEGSWADTFQLASRLQARHIIVDTLCIIGPEKSWEFRTRSDTARPGDLLRISGIHQAFFPLAAVERNSVTGEIVLYAKTGVAFSSEGDQIQIGDPSVWLDCKAALISIDLRVKSQNATEWIKEDLGLTPLHPRYLGALATDIDVYRGDTSASGASHLLPTASGVDSAPWFPLAATDIDKASASVSFMVPLGMDGKFSQGETAIPNPSSELVRDGLANFDASMFLDPALRDASIAGLMAKADAIRYSAAVPRPLTGIHAVLGWFNTSIQDEVTLIAVPDAVHQPWQERPQPLRYSFSVEEILPEENTKKPKSFVCCDKLPAPSKLMIPPGTTARLGWEMPENLSSTAIEYQVQESASPDFLVVDHISMTSEIGLDVSITALGRRIFRVRAMAAGQVSEWSSAIALNIHEIDAAGQLGSTAGTVAREIQHALINLCVAQGELFSVLSLPKSITEQEAVNHVLSLPATTFADTSASSVYFDSEGRIGSYAAIYHPWIEACNASGSVIPLPPDGAILGMIAARTSDRGAWIAPANRVLRSVVALHTAVPDARQALLAGAGINLVLHRPEGYTLLSEDTLSSVADLRPIHVRRLLILLRRIMLRLGEEFTFEVNSLALRALIRQRCNSMLEHMFRAGAFAGRSAAESFQVSVEDTDNPPASIDAGRLIIRIRVRPAQALRFITILLTLGGGASGVTEENAA